MSCPARSVHSRDPIGQTQGAVSFTFKSARCKKCRITVSSKFYPTTMFVQLEALYTTVLLKRRQHNEQIPLLIV